MIGAVLAGPPVLEQTIGHYPSTMIPFFFIALISTLEKFSFKDLKKFSVLLLVSVLLVGGMLMVSNRTRVGNGEIRPPTTREKIIRERLFPLIPEENTALVPEKYFPHFASRSKVYSMGFHPAIAEPGELNTPKKFDYVLIDPGVWAGEAIREDAWERIVENNMGLYAWFDGAYIMKRGYKEDPVDIPPPEGLGLEMALYDNQDFSNQITTVPSLSIDYGWGSRSPILGMDNDHFSVIWTGRIKAPSSGKYKLNGNSISLLM